MVNWDGPDAVERLLQETVDPLPVDLERRVDPDRGDTLVLLLEDGEWPPPRRSSHSKPSSS